MTYGNKIKWEVKDDTLYVYLKRDGFLVYKVEKYGKVASTFYIHSPHRTRHNEYDSSYGLCLSNTSLLEALGVAMNFISSQIS